MDTDRTIEFDELADAAAWRSAPIALMSAKASFSFSDEVVRSVVRILGDVAGMAEDIPARRRRLSEGLAGLIDGDIWIWLLAHDNPNSKDVVGCTFMDGGWKPHEQEQREIFRHSCMSGDLRSIHDKVRGKLDHATVTRRELFSDSEWERSQLLTRHFRKAGVSEFILSVYPLGTQAVSSIFFLRRTGKPLFSAAEKALAHLIVGQVHWMHHNDSMIEIARQVPNMTPRQRQVLFMLLEGDGRKLIARKLRISPHTAADHMQAVYARFDVNSQSELIAHFYRGRGIEQ